eukprot:GEMP01017107.1.p1 GENE.GEMP01017107.1~~GEMP01017107.1.p1  ORF type:complete len:649 (+),score=106.76 GEMP01017107.1:23-1948(+)
MRMLVFVCAVFTALGVPACTDCCEKAARQAYYACLEYEVLLYRTNCPEWQAKAKAVCEAQCGDCASISYELGVLCQDMGRDILAPERVAELCELTVTSYKDARCAAVCEFNHGICGSSAAVDCQYCGNWQACDCYSPHGGSETRCFGDAVLTGISRSCKMMNPNCWNHRVGTACGAYRMCMKNMCLLKEISCEITNNCHKMTTCIAETGTCKHILREDGYACNTGLFYSLEGSGKCSAGDCLGAIDYCCKYNIKCTTDNPCIWETCNRSIQDCSCPACSNSSNKDYECDPLCDTMTGNCLFKNKPDGYQCTTNRIWIVDEVCQNGVCLGIELDLCQDRNVDCSNPPQCRGVGRCSPHDGECHYPPIDGGPCDDNSDQTFHDSCVEGFCRGTYFYDPKFIHIGAGPCADSRGRTVNTFSAHHMFKTDCEAACSADVTCEAYSWSVFGHTCALYSRLREQPRDGWMVERSFFLMVDELTATGTARKGASALNCYKKVLKGIVVSVPMSENAKYVLFISGFYVLLISGVLFMRRETLCAAWKKLDGEIDFAEYRRSIRLSLRASTRQVPSLFRKRLTKALVPKEVTEDLVVVDDITREGDFDNCDTTVDIPVAQDDTIGDTRLPTDSTPRMEQDMDDESPQAAV